MNALKLHHELKARGVNLEAAGEDLRVDAPAGVLTDGDRAALVECKPVLLAFLSRPAEAGPRRSEARWAGPGWIRILDPDTGEWHEVSASTCLPGVVAEADTRRKRGKGGAA
jgi:hypothetical protein